MNYAGHVSDKQLAMLVDGELSGRALAYVERHLAQCDACTRQRRLFEVSGDQATTTLRTDGADDELRGRRLRMRVRNRLRTAHHEREADRFTMWLRRTATLMAGLSVLAAAGVILHRTASPMRDEMVKTGELSSKPNRLLTPGAVHPVEVSALCRGDAGDFDPELPPAVRSAVFRKYGMSDGGVNEYQVDYLVSPQLGGTDEMENLWPEPYGATEWNAHAKDALERRLHDMVCTGQVDLASAQEAIRVDWIGAYGKYMGGVSAR